MRTQLVLITSIFVHMRRNQHGVALVPRRQRNRPLDLSAGPFGGIDDFTRGSINQPMIEALESNANALSGHNAYSITLLTTPAPTVRPPSRMAKRSPSSIAIGAISFTVTLMLSPGITISVPSGRSTAPVTSVVRK